MSENMSFLSKKNNFYKEVLVLKVFQISHDGNSLTERLMIALKENREA